MSLRLKPQNCARHKVGLENAFVAFLKDLLQWGADEGVSLGLKGLPFKEEAERVLDPPAPWLVWGPFLQGGMSQGQVPMGPVMGVPSGQWWQERLPGGGWSAASRKGFLWLRTEICHSQTQRVCLTGWVGPGSPRVRGCGQKTPRMLSVVLLFWG